MSAEVKLRSNGMPRQYSATANGCYVAVISQRGDRWHHDQGTCPPEDFATLEECRQHVDPNWRYVGECRPLKPTRRPT